jgi:hypothetical protein
METQEPARCQDSSSRLHAKSGRHPRRFPMCFMDTRNIRSTSGEPSKSTARAETTWRRRKRISDRDECGRRSSRNSLGWVTRTSNPTFPGGRIVWRFKSSRSLSMIGVRCPGTDTSFVTSRWRMRLCDFGTSGRHETWIPTSPQTFSLSGYCHRLPLLPGLFPSSLFHLGTKGLREEPFRSLRFSLNHDHYVRPPCDTKPPFSLLYHNHDEATDSAAFHFWRALSPVHSIIICTVCQQIGSDPLLYLSNFPPLDKGCALYGRASVRFIGVITRRQILRERRWSCVGMSQ